MFKLIKPVIDGIHTVHAIESRLWSDRLQVAGSVDLICEFDGEATIVDWKSSSRFKSRDEISSYFMQASAYSLMFYERTGIVAKKLKIVMATKDDGLLIFDEDLADWLPKFKKVREEFRQLKGF
jgi:predicted RecB family nuclease